MSSVLPQVWSCLGLIWTTFFTGWRIPLINITPAVLIFGVISFRIALKLITGILEITPHAVEKNADRISFRAEKIRKKD